MLTKRFHKKKRSFFSYLSLFLMFMQSLLPTVLVLSEPLDIAYATVGYELDGLKYGGDPNVSGGWTSGNLCQGGGGCYAEGDSVPARLIVDGLTIGDSYTLKLEHDYTDGAVFGYEFFTTSNPILPNIGASGVGLSAPTSTSCGGGVTCHEYDLSFTADDTEVILYFNAILGVNAADWNGASLHFRLVSGVNEETTGNKEVPIQVNKIEYLPSITLTKNVIDQTTDPNHWCFNVSPAVGGQSQYCIIGDGDGVDTVTLDNLEATSYTVSESGPSNYVFVNGDGSSQSCTFSGDTASVLVSSGNPANNATCVFNNTQALGGLVVRKDVVGPNGEDIDDQLPTFDFSSDIVGHTGFSLGDGDSYIMSEVPVGTYTVSEDVLPAGYEFVSYSIDEDLNQDGAQVTVIAGEPTELLVTNRQVGSSLTVYKHVFDSQGNEINYITDGSFYFEVDQAQSFSLNGGEATAIGPISPGSHTLSEVDLPAGYTFDSFDYDEDLNVPGAQFITETGVDYEIHVYNNMILSEMVVSKVDDVDPVLAGNDFTYTITVANQGTHPLNDIVISDVLPVPFEIVSYSSAATCSLDFNLESIDCTYGTILGGDTLEIDILVHVPYDADEGDYVNTAYISSYEYPDGLEAVEHTNVIEEFDLSIDKTSSAEVVIAGHPVDGAFTYIVRVENYGPSDAGNVTFEDIVPSEFVVQSVQVTDTSLGSTSCQNLGNDVSCDFGDMAPEDYVVLEIAVITPSDSPAGLYTNTAEVEAEGKEYEDTDDVEIIEVVELIVDKDDDVSNVSAGEGFNYVITVDVADGSYSDASNVVLTDEIPAVFTAISVDNPDCGLVGNTLTCDFGTVSPNDSQIVINVAVMVPSDVMEGSYENVAFLTYDQGDDDDNVFTNVDEEVSLYVEKVDDVDPATAGLSTVVYTILVGNGGPSDADNVTLLDTLPVELELVSFDTQVGSCTYNDVDHEVECDFGTLTPGQEFFVYVTMYVPESVDAQVVENHVIVTSDEDEVDTTEETEIIEDVVLNIEKDDGLGSTSVVAGVGIVTYVITYNNSGTSDADNTVIVDALPSEFEYISNDSGCTYDGLGHTITCDIGTLASGGSGEIKVTLSVPVDLEAGTYTNDVVITSDEDSDDASDDTDVIEEIGLQVDKVLTSYNNHTAGADTVSFELRVRNIGPSDAENVILLDDMSDFLQQMTDLGYSFADINLSIVSTVGTCNSVSASDNLLNCNLGDLDVYSDNLSNGVIITVSFDIPEDYESGTYVNDVEVFSDDGGYDNDSEEFIVDELAILEIDKSVVQSYAIAGSDTNGLVDYTIIVTNTGPSDAENVTVLDTFPLEFTPETIPAECTIVGNDITCIDGDLAVGETLVYAMQFSVDASIENGDYINTSYAKSDECRILRQNFASVRDELITWTPYPDGYCVMDDVSIPVIEEAELVILKIDTEDPVSQGQEFDYIITGQNDGPSDTENVFVSDQVPDEFEVLGVSTDKGSCLITGNLVECWIGDLLVDETFEITINVKASLDAASDVYENTVYVNSDEDEGTEAYEETEVLDPPELTIVKSNSWTGSGEELFSGDIVTYTLTVEVFNAPLNDIVLTDILPAGLTYVDGSGSAGLVSYIDGVGSWNLGQMEVGDIAILTYKAVVDSGTSTGTYKDLAWAEGVSDGNVELLAQSVVGDPSYITESIVGTEVEVSTPDIVAEAGVVLGTSIVRLPNTGIGTNITVFALFTLIIGMLMMFGDQIKGLFGRRKFIVSATAFAVLLLAPSVVHAASTAVLISEPSSPVSEAFDISYVLVAFDESRSVECLVKAPGSSGFTQFGTVKSFTGNGTGACDVSDSILDTDGIYEFKVRSYSISTEEFSDTVAVIFDATSPEVPTEYEREEFGTCNNRIRVQTATDSQTEVVEIHRSTQESFTANASTLIAEINVVAPGDEVVYEDVITNCSVQYYYVARAIDGVGNISEFIGDEITVTEFINEPVKQTGGGDTGEVAGARTDNDEAVSADSSVDENGEVLGEDATDTNGDVAGEDTKADSETADEDSEREDAAGGSAADQSFIQKYGEVILILGLFGAIGYWLFRRNQAQ